MKILFITPFSPDNQGKCVSYTGQLLKELSKDHIIDLVYFRYRNDSSYVPYNTNINVILEKVISIKDKIIGILSLPFIFPLFTSRFNVHISSFLQRKIVEVDYDYIYFDFSQTFAYVPYLHHPNKILMSHDVIAQKYSRMKRYLRPWAVASEKFLLNRGGAIFTFSEKDSSLIKNLYNIDSYHTTFFLNENVIRAVPNINSDYYVFFGAWSREENLEGLKWFLDNVYNYLPQNINFKIIGGGLPDAQKARIKILPNVEYLGYVDNPYPIIANAKAEIAPLHMGAGVKVKCIEALGVGTPIIGTQIAFEGISDKYNKYMLLANKPEDYVNYILNFPLSLSDKNCLKKDFISNYDNKTILNYINQ